MEDEGGKRLCEDRPNSASATAAASGTKALKRPCEDLIEHDTKAKLWPFPKGTPATAAAYGGKRLCEDRPNSASATADASSEALNRSWKDSVKIPPETVAAYAEVIALYPELEEAYPDVYVYHFEPGRYAWFDEGGHLVHKVDKWNVVPVPRIRSAGPDPLKEDPSAVAAAQEEPLGCK